MYNFHEQTTAGIRPNSTSTICRGFADRIQPAAQRLEMSGVVHARSLLSVQLAVRSVLYTTNQQQVEASGVSATSRVITATDPTKTTIIIICKVFLFYLPDHLPAGLYSQSARNHGRL